MRQQGPHKEKGTGTFLFREIDIYPSQGKTEKKY